RLAHHVPARQSDPRVRLRRRRGRGAAVRPAGRCPIHGPPDPRGARVRTGTPGVSRGELAAAGLLGCDHRRLARRHADRRDRRAPRGGWRVRERADPGHDVTRRVAGALVLAAVLTMGACGTTYVDDSAGTTAPGAATTLAPVRPGTPLDE